MVLIKSITKCGACTKSTCRSCDNMTIEISSKMSPEPSFLIDFIGGLSFIGFVVFLFII